MTALVCAVDQSDLIAGPYASEEEEVFFRHLVMASDTDVLILIC